MALLSMNELTTLRWSFEEDVARFSQAGFAGIGIWRQKLSDYGEEKGIELIVESGLRVSSLLWAGGFTGSDGRTYQESIDDAAEAVRLAGQMNAGSLLVYSGARAGHTYNHARRLIREALKQLGDVATAADVVMALEPMHVGCATEWTFLTSLDDALELLDEVGCDRIKLTFDTYHLGYDPAVVARVPEIVERTALVQLGDGRAEPDHEQNRCRLGEGCIPLQQLIAAFNEAGYSGFYDVELLGEDVEHISYEDLLAHSKQAFDQLLSSQAA